MILNFSMSRRRAFTILAGAVLPEVQREWSIGDKSARLQALDDGHIVAPGFRVRFGKIAGVDNCAALRLESMEVCGNHADSAHRIPPRQKYEKEARGLTGSIRRYRFPKAGRYGAELSVRSRLAPECVLVLIPHWCRYPRRSANSGKLR